MIRRALRYIFIEDFWAKLFCLIIGGGLWFYVQFARVSENTFNIPLEYVKKPSNLYIKAGAPRFIKIVVRGRDEFLKFSTTGIKAEVNLHKAKSGEASYPVVFDTRQLPERVEIFSKPKTISVELERGRSRKFTIKPILTGSPDAAYKILRVTTIPTQLELSGPETVMTTLQNLETEPLDLDGTKTTFSKRVPLRLPEDVWANETRFVTVKVELLAKTVMEEEKFEDIPIRLQNLDGALDALLSEKTVTVLLQGEGAAIRRLTPNDVYAFVDLQATRWNKQTGEIIPQPTASDLIVKARLLTHGKKIQVVSVTPDKVSVRFSIKDGYQKKQEGNN